MIIPQSGKTSACVRLGRHGNLRVYRLAPGIISGGVTEEKSSDDAPKSSGDAPPQASWIDKLMRDP
jgi:hypothetical protein